MDYKTSKIEIDKLVEITTNELYFAVIKGLTNRRMRSTVDTLYFSVDDELFYHNYYSDFGPLSISCLYKYCTKLNKYLIFANGVKRVVHYTSNNDKKKANAAYLMGAYAVIYLKFNPDLVAQTLDAIGPFKNFVDASQCPSGYRLRIVDCLHAIYKALSFNFFNFVDFNMVEYDMRNTLQYGDLNWLVPRKFLAFIGPTENEFLNGRPPEFYVKYFLQNDVKTVIRLNNKFYDSNAFKTVGIEHYDLIFPDGSTPPREILFRFLEISETAPAAIGVHCKAGLGRTGSLIGAYLLKHYHMTAREAIAWMRICRPGSVIGYQQNWLEKIQGMMWSLGAEYRGKLGEPDKIPFHKYGIYSRKWPLDREKMIRAARKKIKSKLSHTRSESVSRASITTSKSTSISEKKTDKSPLKQIMKVIEQHKNTNSESSKRPISTGNNILKKVVFDDKLEKKRSRTRKNKSSTQGDKLNDIKVARQSSPDKFNKLGSLHKVAILFEKTQKR